jgi:hypothetical protein
MKKLLLVLLIVLLATPCFAKEYRIKMDVLLVNETRAIALWNEIESRKHKFYQPTGLEDYIIPAYVCFIDSWDTETPAKPGSERFCMDLETSAEVEIEVDGNIDFLTTSIARRQAKVDTRQANIDAAVAAIAVMQAELDALIAAQ